MDDEIICRVEGEAGTVLLNRPKALNAVTHGMVTTLAAALARWAEDPAVTRVVVTGAGERAFSAGGDIRALFEAGRAGRFDEALAFWRDEYRLNVVIKRFPKPYVALIDGFVMGGGVGLSLHGSHRVAGDRYLFAMPEVAIGFFPDVGATWALPRLPGGMGAFLALTGERVGPDDAVRLGLATHRVRSADLAALRERLCAGEPVDALLPPAPPPDGTAPLALGDRTVIARCFSAETVTAILHRLDTEAERGSAFAAETARTMRSRSPTSLSVAMRQMRVGAGLSFEEAMELEWRIVSRLGCSPDFHEGVRAAIIDKDARPVWSPASLSQVDDVLVDEYMAGAGGLATLLPGRT